jgi:hypothetical protein
MHTHITALKNLPVSSSQLPPVARPGCPSKTSTIQDRRLKSYVKQNPFKSACQLKNEVAGWADVSVRTFQDRLQKKLGLPSRRAAKKPLLTSAMRKKRLAFAIKYKNWNVSQWRNFMTVMSLCSAWSMPGPPQ